MDWQARKRKKLFASYIYEKGKKFEKMVVRCKEGFVLCHGCPGNPLPPCEKLVNLSVSIQFSMPLLNIRFNCYLHEQSFRIRY